MNSIRARDAAIPAEHAESLEQMGLILCTKNLAKHVTMMLGRDVESLDTDADARRVVEQVAITHEQMLKRRMGLSKIALKRAGLTRVPFGRKSIGNGIDRFVKDLRSMEPFAKKRQMQLNR